MSTQKNPRPTTTPAEPRAFAATQEALDAVLGPRVTVPPPRMKGKPCLA